MTLVFEFSEKYTFLRVNKVTVWVNKNKKVVS